MKIKFKILMCLMVTITSSTIVALSATSAPKENAKYLPILSYQKTLADMISNYIMAVFYKKDQKAKKVGKANPKEEVIAIIKEEDIPKIDRDEALDAMKVISTKLFDLNNTDSLSAHLLALKELCDNLDPEIDKKTITAIHFLLENQHRAGVLNYAFWINANSKYGLEDAIPMTAEVAKRPRADKLGAINKKITLQAQRLKDETNAQSAIGLPITV